MRCGVKLKEEIRANKRLFNILICIRREFGPFGFIRNYIVFPIRRVFRKFVYCPKRCKEIQKLKDVHKGERCFIIATGPSLTLDDVKLLKDEYTIAINTIFRLYPELEWRPTYYAMTDPVLTNKILNKESVSFDDFAARYCILNSLNRKKVDCKKAIFIDNNWLDHVYKYGKSNKFKYDPDLRFGVYDYYSITQECIIYAIYMGFKEIYILGADNNYLGDKQHFARDTDESKMKYELAVASQKANDMGYEYVAKVAKNAGVKVFNATRGGKVKAFPRVNLEDIVGMVKK